MGGYAGAAIAKAGFGALILSGWTLPLLFIVLSPLLGMLDRARADGRALLAALPSARRGRSTGSSAGSSCCRPPSTR